MNKEEYLDRNFRKVNGDFLGRSFPSGMSISQSCDLCTWRKAYHQLALTFTAHLLVLRDLRPTFFLKLFFPAYLWTQAKSLKGTAPHDKNQNYSSNNNCPGEELWPRRSRPVWTQPLTHTSADGPWSDPQSNQQLPLPHYNIKISPPRGTQASFIKHTMYIYRYISLSHMYDLMLRPTYDDKVPLSKYSS